MSRPSVIALLGRRDQPTDAVEEYCRHLGEALASHDLRLEIRRVPWDERGWASSLQALRLQAQSWRGRWVLVQYTALAWSARGFPRRFLTVIRALRLAGARIAVVYHDVEPFGGLRVVDRVRRAYQLRVMRLSQELVDQAVFTVDPRKLSWNLHSPSSSVFIPVGANLPVAIASQKHRELHSPPTVAVYGITGGATGERETQDILATLRYAAQKIGSVRLLVFGRHAEEREASLSQGLEGCAVELRVEGLVQEADLPARFAAADILLFVRGAISSRRGSAIAGIACGLPVIAFRGAETAAPITDAGVVLLDQDADDTARQRRLGAALVEVLLDQNLREDLAKRSQSAQERFFSWQSIAARYADFLLTESNRQ